MKNHLYVQTFFLQRPGLLILPAWIKLQELNAQIPVASVQTALFAWGTTSLWPTPH